jgi:hypothetical protein
MFALTVGRKIGWAIYVAAEQIVAFRFQPERQANQNNEGRYQFSQGTVIHDFTPRAQTPRLASC